MENFRRGGGSGGSGGFQRRNNMGPRELHDATCSKCGKECQVPFKPHEGKPVYCKDCYAEMRNNRDSEFRQAA